MSGNVKMMSADAVSAKMAECYVTIKDVRYNFMQMLDFEAKIEKQKTNVPILGRPMDGNKATGASGTFSGTAHYNQSIMRKMMIDYMNTGEDVYFEIQVTNEDKTTSVGRQTVVFGGCNLDEVIAAKFDAAGEYLDETFNGTFENCNLAEAFKELQGMR